MASTDETNNKSAPAAIAHGSAQPTIIPLSVYYAALFFVLAIWVVAIWPPPPAVPFIEVSPPTVTIPPGFIQQFDASIWHERDQSVTWSSTDGVITPTGLFTAPTAAAATGRIVITATSNSDKTLARSALVLINTPGLAIEPKLVSLVPSETKSFRALQQGAPAAPPAPTLEWLASDPAAVEIHADAAGTTADVKETTSHRDQRTVILTVRDKANPTRQASAIVYLSKDQVPLVQDLAQDELFRDRGLLQLVMLMGALGALLGASRSLANFIGNDTFVPRWTLFYIFRPTFGAGLALVVFFGYRIGAISGVKGAAPADPFAAAFVAGMVGLFADTVLQKLKDVITALFPTQDERKDKVSAPDSAAAPVIDLVVVSDDKKQITVKGKNLVDGSKVTINGKDRKTTFVKAGELTVVLDPADTGDIKVVVNNPDKQTSPEFPTTIGA